MLRCSSWPVTAPTWQARGMSPDSWIPMVTNRTGPVAQRPSGPWALWKAFAHGAFPSGLIIKIRWAGSWRGGADAGDHSQPLDM